MNTKPSCPTKAAKKKIPFSAQSLTIKDPVEVICRLRPLEDPGDYPCVQPISKTTIQLIPPDTSQQLRNGVTKELQYTFHNVFDELSTQKQIFDEISLPLLRDLFKGKNGLLFTYGITSSGKTYTMTGSPNDNGILPRCLDVIFNTIHDNQTRKFVFKSDKLNGFDVQSTAEAMLDQQKELKSLNLKTYKKKKEMEQDWCKRNVDLSKVDDIDLDKGYAVYISYVEIYKNYVYDLLDEAEDSTISGLSQSRMLREDIFKNMYVFKVTEPEVKSSDEAFEYFCRGQVRKKISQTDMNPGSSRSHSIFTIRLVQAPLDSQGSDVLVEKNLITVSQLSLVDLAGSERIGRTGNIGERLKESGNINSSLMSLKTCIEILRENQLHNANKMVPYRDNKLTHIFKAYFEGKGKIKMIVCISPRAKDYDETIHVMKFAKLTQEVVVERRMAPKATPIASFLISGRGTRYKEAVKRANEEGVDVSEFLAPSVYTLGPSLPSFAFQPILEKSDFDIMIKHLDERYKKREFFITDLQRKHAQFRQAVKEMEEENISMKQNIYITQNDLCAREEQVLNLEKKLAESEYTKTSLHLKIDEHQQYRKEMENKLEEKEMLLKQGQLGQNKLKSIYQDRIMGERERLNKLMKARMAEKQAEMESKLCISEEKFKKLKRILTEEDILGNSEFTESTFKDIRSQSSDTKITCQTNLPPLSPISNDTITIEKSAPENSPLHKSFAVVNHRFSKSLSVNGNWVNHRSKNNLDLGTVFQPKLKQKSVSKLNPKDFTKDGSASKYLLQHQEQDELGEIETQLYKGEMIPSVGGGVQVIFKDVETLKQISPPSANKRAYPSQTTATLSPHRSGLMPNYSMSIEGKPAVESPKRRRI